MPVKLFATDNNESKQVIGLLEQAEVAYDLIDPDASILGYQVMFSVTGTRRAPVLCVDGKAYRGLEGAQRFLA